jgi:flagellar M-ring protein FliF
LQSLFDNLRNLGPVRMTVLSVTMIIFLFVILFGVRMATTPTFAPLYSGLPLSSASQVVQALEQSGFRVELDAGGTVIRVPQADVARARMALAEQGLPNEGAPGWELFDAASGLGMNTFMQQISRLRALEGELARSIRTIQGVEAARVHLVLPDREAFSRSRPEPSASVIVQARSGQSLSHRQALAIRSLVASAVPGLTGSRVTILSATGEAILPENGELEANVGSMTAAVEERLSRNVADILSARVGAGNVRISVNVRLGTEREIIRSQEFNPEGQVARSTEVREEASEDRTGGPDAVDVSENIPPSLGGGATGGTGSFRRSSTTNTVTNFEIGTTQRELVREPGQLERISVAVLVNGVFTLNDAGDRVYQDRSPEELARLLDLVRTAVGYDASRGDSVTVESFQFADYLASIEPPERPSLMDLAIENFDLILRGLFALILVLLALMLGVRPVLQNLFAKNASRPTNVGAVGATPTAVGQPGAAQVVTYVTQPGVPMAGQVVGQATGADVQAAQQTLLMNLKSVEGRVQPSLINSLKSIVESDRDRALQVIQTWLSDDE